MKRVRYKRPTSVLVSIFTLGLIMGLIPGSAYAAGQEPPSREVPYPPPAGQCWYFDGTTWQLITEGGADLAGFPVSECGPDPTDDDVPLVIPGIRTPEPIVVVQPPQGPPPPPQGPPPSDSDQDVLDSFEYSDDEDAMCAESSAGVREFLGYLSCAVSRLRRPPIWNPEQRRRGEYPEVNIQLQPNPGYASYQPPEEQWGRQETIDTLAFLGTTWGLRHFILQDNMWDAPRIQIGDISYEGGGDHPQHRSHHEGLDIDIRVLRNDLRERPCRVNDPSCYDRELTQELIDILVMQAEAPGGIPVQYIFTADRDLRGPANVLHYDNHHYDHIHVRLRPRP
jgi:hypothetical protein